MNSAAKLLKRMRASSAGWGQDHLHKVYVGHGFECREGGGHRLYKHPALPTIRVTVPRHDDLAPKYAILAVRNIDLLTAGSKDERND